MLFFCSSAPLRCRLPVCRFVASPDEVWVTLVAVWMNWWFAIVSTTITIERLSFKFLFGNHHHPVRLVSPPSKPREFVHLDLTYFYAFIAVIRIANLFFFRSFHSSFLSMLHGFDIHTFFLSRFLLVNVRLPLMRLFCFSFFRFCSNLKIKTHIKVSNKKAFACFWFFKHVFVACYHFAGFGKIRRTRTLAHIGCERSAPPESYRLWVSGI